jgi:hypothetical protein
MKPILFNTEMVKAILDARKTQTRRPIMPQPEQLPRLTGLWRWRLTIETKKSTAQGRYDKTNIAV